MEDSHHYKARLEEAMEPWRCVVYAATCQGKI